MPRKKMDDADQLANIIEKRELLYREAAQLLGVHERTIYKWLARERRIPPMALRLLEMMRFQRVDSN